MIEDYMINEAENLNISQDELLMDPVKLMILIYVCNDDTIPNKHIEKCKINPSTGVINYRTDLEFYVQLHLYRFLNFAITSSFIAAYNPTTCVTQSNKCANLTTTLPISTTST